MDGNQSNNNEKGTTSHRSNKRSRLSLEFEDALYYLNNAARKNDESFCRRIWRCCGKKTKKKLLSMPNYSQRGEFAHPLHTAVEADHQRVFQVLVEELGFNIDQGDGSHSPLGVACMEENLDFCKFLLALGADPNIGGYNQYELLDDEYDIYDYEYYEDPYVAPFSPMFPAAISNNTAIVRLLLDNGADPNKKYPDEESVFDAELHDDDYPLKSAIQNGNIPMLELLLEKGTEFVNVSTCFGCSSWENVQVEQVLARFAKKMPQVKVFLEEAGIESVRNMDANMLERLLQVGSSLDSYCSYADYSERRIGDIVRCCCFRHFRHEHGVPEKYNQMFELCLRHGANIDVIIYDKTSLQMAVDYNNYNVCQWLLEKGAAVYIFDPLGTTALQAVQLKLMRHTQNQFDASSIDSDYSIDSDNYAVCLDENDITKLLSICELLLNYGADPFLSSEKCGSALKISTGLEDTRFLRLFLDEWDERFRNNLSGTNDDGDFPLHAALGNENLTLPAFKVLFRHNPNAVRALGGTEKWLPLHIACLSDCSLDIVYTLLQSWTGALVEGIDPSITVIEQPRRVDTDETGDPGS